MNLEFITEFFIPFTVLAALFSLLFDLVLSDPETKFHPVNLIGYSLSWLKNRLRTNIKTLDKVFGILLLILIILLFCIPIFLIQILLYYLFISINLFIKSSDPQFDIILTLIFSMIIGFLLKWSFSIRYLGRVTSAIQNELEEGNLDQSRSLLSFIVRRDTRKLSEKHLISATVEVIAESATDSVISVFWFYFVGNLLGLVLYMFEFNYIGLLFLGVPFAYMYRVINTGDSIVGYKDPEHINIGWFSAKMDDVSNFIPTRLTVFFMLLSGCFFSQLVKNAWKILKRDKKTTESLNAGWLMSLIAGLLGVQLEKIGKYKLGDPIRPLIPDDISLTYKIIVLSIISFVFIVGFIFLIIELFLISVF